MKKICTLNHILPIAVLLLFGTAAQGQSGLSVNLQGVSGACNGNFGIIAVSASGGQSPYSYSWSNATSGPVANNLAPGVYTVTATDAAGASATLSVDVPQVAQLNVSLILTKAECPGVNDGTATALITPALSTYSYQWSVPGSPNSAQITGLAAGQQVCVTVTDVNSGCTGTACGTIASHNQVKVVTHAIDASCIGVADGAATAIASLGAEPYTFVWHYPSGATSTDIQNDSSTINGLVPGVYSVSVTDDRGCTTIGAASIGGSGIPDADFEFEITECDADSNLVKIVLHDQSTAVPPVSIASWHWLVTWSNGFMTYDVQNTPTLALPGGESGIIKLWVETPGGCADTLAQPYALPLPPQIELSVAGDTIVCPGDPVSITVTGSPTYTYTWSPQTDLDLSNWPFTVVANPDGTTSYVVTAAIGVCSSSDTVTIIRPPGAHIDLPGGSLITCNDTVTINLQPFGQGVVLWLNEQLDTIGNDISVTFPVNDTATVIVIGVDAYGCVTSDTATVINHGSDVDISAPPVDSLCANIPFQLQAVNHNPGDVLSYLWLSGNPALQITNPGSANPTLQGPAGDYVVTLIAINQYNCIDTATVDIHILPGYSLQGDVSIDLCNGLSVQFTNLDSLAAVWYFGDNSSSTLSDPLHVYAQAGTYEVSLVSSQICAVPFDTTIVVLPTEAVQAAFEFEVLECDADSNLVKIVLHDQSAAVAPVLIANWHWLVNWGSGNIAYDVQNPPALWLPGGASGVIKLWVETNSGCIDSLELPFTLPTPPQIQLSVGADTVACPGEPVSITVSGSPDYTYTWSPQTNLDLSNWPFTVVANPDGTTTYVLTASIGAACSSSDSVTIIRPPGVQIDLPGGSLITCNDTVTIDLQPFGQGVVVWLNEQLDTLGSGITVTFPVSDTATVIVIGVDAYGCISSDTATVISRSADVDVAAPPVDSLCAGIPFQLQAVNHTPGDMLSYLWLSGNPALQITNPGNANPTLQGPAGDYVVTLIAANQYNCIDTATVNIHIQAPYSLQGDVSVNLCNGLSVQFTNLDTLSAVWHFGDNSSSTLSDPLHVYAQAGTYEVSLVSNAVCTTPFDTTIIVLPSDAVQASFAADVTNCRDSATVVFQNTTQHAYPVQYLWVFQPGGQTSVAANPTMIFQQEDTITATLYVTDINGCADTATMDLQIFIIDINLDHQKSFCPDDSVALNPSGNPLYNYGWTSNPTDPDLQGNAANPVVSPDVTTLYSVSIHWGDCSVTDSVWVTPLSGPALNAGPDISACDSNLVTVTATVANAVSIQWSDKRNFQTNLGNTPGIQVKPKPNTYYYVRAVSVDGCVAIDSVLVDNNQVDIAYSKKEAVCDTTPISLDIQNLDAGDLLSFLWSPTLPNVPNPSVKPTFNTSYTAIVSNQFGCKDTATIQVNVSNLDLDVHIVGLDTIMRGDSATLVAIVTGGTGYTYQWLPVNDLYPPTDQSTVIAQPGESTDYTVIVTDTLTGCTAQASIRLTVLSMVCDSPFIFVPSAFTPNGDGNNDFFRVRSTEVTELHFMVYNRWGEKLYETNEVDHQGWDGTVRGERVSPDSYGWYLRAICIDGQEYIGKGNVTLLR